MFWKFMTNWTASKRRHSHIFQRGCMVLMIACSILFLSWREIKPAFAAQAKPPTDWSYYIDTNSTSRAYTLGCNQGKFDASYSSPPNSEVVLDFGGQNSSGNGTLTTVNNISLSNAQIEAISEQFAQGYWDCTGSDSTSTLTLGIGTNNSYYNVSTSGGQAWGQLVNTIKSYVSSKGESGQVGIEGADDIEPGFGSASAAIAWVNGYSSVSGVPHYLDYGSADGCPQNSSNNGSCNNGWNQYDEWYVSWGASPALALPEIYFNGQQQEWAMISLYGARYQNSTVYMQGPMNEHDLDTASYTSATAWNVLWTSLNNNATTAQSMSYSVEIHDE